MDVFLKVFGEHFNKRVDVVFCCCFSLLHSNRLCCIIRSHEYIYLNYV